MALLSLGALLLLSETGRAAVRSPEEMAELYRAAVDLRLAVPPAEAQLYALWTEAALARTGRVPAEAQYLLVVDRDPLVQAALLMWRGSGGEYRLVGASPVSTGHPGPFDARATPQGVFPIAPTQTGQPVFEFGSQPVGKHWGEGKVDHMRVLVRPPEAPALERRLGLAQSDGAIVVPARLAQLMLALRLLPLGSPAALVVLDSGRSERPDWSPAPYVPQVKPRTPAGPLPSPMTR